MQKKSKIFITGHKGLVGSAVCRKLNALGYNNLILKTRDELDLCNQLSVDSFFEKEKPDYVFHCAAKVGGIVANMSYPAEFIYENMMISANIIHSSYKHSVKKLINLGSSCIYPKFSAQPIKEEYLLSAPLEETNEAYAIAKICAIKQCKFYNEQYGTNFISAMPTNQYGINDNFNMETAHLLPMLMRRFHLAKLFSNNDFRAIENDISKNMLGWGLDNSELSLEEKLNKLGVYKDKVVVWGDGSVYRELMNSDDLADACIYLMQNKDYKEVGEFVNITSGDDIQLDNLFKMVKNIVGFCGKIEYDDTKPNGTPRKLMDSTKIKALGWSPKINLETGISNMYKWYTK